MGRVVAGSALDNRACRLGCADSDNAGLRQGNHRPRRRHRDAIAVDGDDAHSGD